MPAHLRCAACNGTILQHTARLKVLWQQDAAAGAPQHRVCSFHPVCWLRIEKALAAPGKEPVKA